MQTVLEISVKEAQEQLSQNKPRPTLLDVREDMEIAVCRINGATHIPLHKLENALEALPKESPLLVYCHHGRRSLLAANYLNSKGFSAISIIGGIDAWAQHVDPSVARY